jgi:biopolymer transport protein ExbD
MSASAGPKEEDEGMGMITDINVTPMVDIMLVLLIIFMVTASLIVSPSMKVELPRGGAKATASKEPDVVVVVTRTGEMEIRQQKLTPEKLMELLRGEHQKKPAARLLVVADRKAYHGNVVKVMDIAKAVGFQRLGVAVEGTP